MREEEEGGSERRRGVRVERESRKKGKRKRGWEEGRGEKKEIVNHVHVPSKIFKSHSQISRLGM